MDVYAITNAQGDVLSKDEVDDLLEEIGISQDVIDEDSTTAVQEYAQENNIDLTQLTDMAKKLTDNKVEGAADMAKGDYANELKNLGIPENVIKQGNDAIIAYAAQNGIQLPNSTGTQLNIKS